MRIRAAVIREAGGAFSFEELELDEPKAGELLVRVVASGICSTDEAARQQHAPVPLPAVLGHEGAGIVERIGANVSAFSPGDRVCFSFSSCGCCEPCQEGKPYICEESGRLNFGGVLLDGTRRLHKGDETLSAFFGQGSFATWAVVSERNAIPVDKDIPLEVAAPFGCGIQTGAGTVLNVLDGRAGEAIAVFGMGAVGMSAIMAAALAGLNPIIAVGGNAQSLALARELGATHALNRHEVDDLARAIVALTRTGAHYSIDTTGAKPLIMSALHCLRPEGSLALLAPCEELTLDVVSDLIGPTRRILGVTEGASNPPVFIPRLLRLYREGRFPVDRIISCYPFADIDRAFADSLSGKVIKAVVQM
ncbi:MAG: NAD(P)-dependent alcohol dehydrogenase [Coriobacteriales bacterium]|jgi:aryl-alcohol dehydrogenase|nr:NAD(P)-dependent alcohol dehydrogenase [Coriobacteriales bacterium]